MNPMLYCYPFKALLAFTILLIHVQVFSQTKTYTATNSGDFKTLSNWHYNGKQLTSTEYATGLVNFAIGQGITMTLEGNATVGNLTLQLGGRLDLSAGNLTIQKDLNINTTNTKNPSIIDFGTENGRLTVNGNLNGGQNSTIIHQGTKRQELILNGESNTLDIFENDSKGASIVRYAAKGNQTVFNSDRYQNLVLEGAGIKTLESTPKSTLDGTTVSHALTISNCRLYLGNYNVTYDGPESSLSYSNGWVVTNGSGVYKNSASEETLTFPVGDSKNMQAIRFSDIKAPNTTVEVRFGVANTSNGSVPNGSDVWYVTASQPTSAAVTLISPVASPTLVSTSKISLYNAGWKTQPTVYNSRLLEYSADVVLQKSGNSIGILTCPSFTLSSTAMPDAETGTSYSNNTQVTGASPTYSLTQLTSTPAGFKGTIDAFKGNITFSNSKPGTDKYILDFTVRDTLRCETPFKLTVNIKSTETTWDGKSWSDGEPDATKDVIFKGDYTVKQNDSLKAKNIRMEATLTIPASALVIISGTLINNGKIVIDCGGILTYNGFRGNDVTDNNPVILPESLNPAIAGDSEYSVYFSVNDSPENITLSPVPPNFAFNPDKALLTSIAPKPGLTTFTVTYTNNGCTVNKEYSIKIIDLPSPNLSIDPIGTKVVDGNAFRLTATTRSRGAISYSIVPGGCATVTAAGIVSMTCAGTVTVQATQDATNLYKSETTAQTFTILPAKAKILIRNFAFIVNENNAIRVTTKSAGAAVSFDQLTGFNTATVNPATGAVIPKASGTFAVHISIAGTANYMAFDSVYTFNVVSLQKPPVAVSDTIVLETGKDSTINILDNDMGMTEAIIHDQTDIDIENRGIQVKYYATELGNFIIDAEGNLTVKPFYGFIGSNRIGYTITDANGLTSEVAYIDVTVKPPFEIPELKANEVMTPNNDNMNDALVIANTDVNKANSLVVMDGIGNMIYEKINYQNDWEGIDNNENTLEPGIYFYIFKETTTGRQLTKYIQIVK